MGQKKREPHGFGVRERETQDAHLRLTRRVPEQEERGGAEEGVEWHGGTGGRVESVGACLRNSRSIK